MTFRTPSFFTKEYKLPKKKISTNMFSNNFKKIVFIFLMFSITVLAGFYAQVIGKNEIVHFWIATPAGKVTEPMVLRGAGPPINLSPLVIDLNQRGLLKNLIQPNVEAISTHWIYNLGKKPVKIRMELENCTIPVKWEVNSNFPYDPKTHTFTQLLMPGKSIPNLGIDWIFEIPENSSDNMWNGSLIIYQGGLKLVDADSGELLTFIPIIIARGVVAYGGSSCCG